MRLARLLKGAQRLWPPTREEAGEKGRLMLLPRRHWLPSAGNNAVLFSPGSSSDQQNGPALLSLGFGDNAQFCRTRARAPPPSESTHTPLLLTYPAPENPVTLPSLPLFSCSALSFAFLFSLSLVTGSAGVPVLELEPWGREGGLAGGCALVMGEESARFSSRTLGRVPAGALKCKNTSHSLLFLPPPPAPLPLSWAEEGPPVSGHGAPGAPLDTFFAQTERDNGGKRSPVFGTVQTPGAQPKKKLGGEMKGLCLPLSGSGGLGTRERLLERRRQRTRETETGVDVRAPGVT